MYLPSQPTHTLDTQDSHSVQISHTEWARNRVSCVSSDDLLPPSTSHTSGRFDAITQLQGSSQLPHPLHHTRCPRRKKKANASLAGARMYAPSPRWSAC